MTINAHKNYIALKAVHWYVENIYGKNINLNNQDAIKNYFTFVKEHNDMTLEIYWNDFATEYNRDVSDEDMLPCINHQEAI